MTNTMGSISDTLFCGGVLRILDSSLSANDGLVTRFAYQS